MAKPFRRRYLINTGFQLRWSLMIALVGALTSTIFSVFLWSAIEEQNRLINATIEYDHQLFEASQDTAILLLNLPETTQIESEEIGKRFDKAAGRNEATQLHKAQLIVHNEETKTHLVIAVILVTFALFVIGILATHSIAGPMLVIKQQLETFRIHRRIDPRTLRKGDEFKDVYETMLAALGEVAEPQEDEGPTEVDEVS